MNLWEVIMDAADETETGIPSSSSVPTLTEYIRWIRKAVEIITNYTDCLDQLITFSSVANQQKYTVPARFIRPISVEYIRGTQSIYRLEYRDIQSFRYYQQFNYTTGIPQICTVWEKNLYIYPPVSSSAGTTTLDGNITATDTTITVDSTSNFPKRGRIIIENEVIEYTDTNSTQFLNCTRGVEGTDAVSHSDGKTVTERDIWVHSSVRYLRQEPTIYNTGTVSATNGSATITGSGTTWSSNVISGWVIGIGTNPTKFYTISSVDSDTQITISENYEGSDTTGASYIIASLVEFPTQYSDLITLYLIYRTKRRLEELQQASLYRAEFEDALNKCRYEMIQKRQNIEYLGMPDF